MKKLILVLVILLTVPAFGDLSISLTQQGTTNLFDLNYAGADTANLPRAFALNIEVNSPAKITDVTNFKTGESTSASPGFGIYPAKIVIADGNVTTWGTPLADEVNDPGAAGTGLGTNKVVLEFGSLYVGESNAPATSGTLCTLAIDCNGATGNVTIVATEEDTYRGGVVLEEGNSPSPNLTATSVPYACAAPCPGQANGPTPANGATDVARSTNLSWNAGSDANSHRIFFGPNSVSEMVFVAEQSGVTYDPNATGDLGQGKKYYWRIDEKNDCGITTGVVWDFNTQECVKTTAAFYTVWKGGGTLPWSRPDCWCYQRNCRGDADGLKQLNLYWVYTNDLTIFRGAYGKLDAQLTGNRICADFKRDKQLNLYRVYTNDLTPFRQAYGKLVTQVPICDSNLVNFWMN